MKHRYCTIKQEHSLDESLDRTTLLSICEPAIKETGKGIHNTSYPKYEQGCRHDCRI